jgi:hypothetical protein
METPLTTKKASKAFGPAPLWLLLGVLVAPVLAQTPVQPLPQPKGPVLLTVSGLISQRNAGDAAAFDADMLAALPAAQIVTKTPWHAAPARFSGPALKTLLERLGARGKVLRLTALDHYEVSVPMQDLELYAPVLALRMDDKALTIRSKGPVLLMYPFDSYPAIDTDLYYGRSVWQLQRIQVE